jgi:type VI secretion system protein ImpM
VDSSPPSQPASSLAVGAFGKLPKVGDFVRVGLASEVTRGFEEWLHQGVQCAHDKRGATWKQAFGKGSVYAFNMSVQLGDERTGQLSGLLKPSADSVGRAFPLAVYTSPPSGLPHVSLPDALGTFLDDVADIVSQSDALSAGDLERRLPLVHGIEDAGQIARNFESWSRTTRLSDVWRSIYDSDDLARPIYALYTLLEIERPLRGRPLRKSPAGVRFPLGRLGVTAAAFWLDVVRSVFKLKSPSLSFFWFFDGQRGDILIQLGRTPAASFAELWWPDSRNEAMSDLILLPPWDGAFDRLPPLVRETLRRPHSTVSELLAAIAV